MSKRSLDYSYEATSTFSKNSISFKWTINNFSFCSLKEDEHFTSPIFASDNGSWKLEMCPKSKSYAGKVVIYLYQIGTKPGEKVVSYKMSLQGKNGVDHYIQERQHIFSGPLSGYSGMPFIVDRNVLMKEKKDELLPGDTLTVFCELNAGGTLTHSPMTPVGGRGGGVEGPKDDSEVEKLVTDFRRMLYGHKSCDVVLLSSDGQTFPAHRAILEARSSVFSAMFQHDMAETRRGEVCIEDIEGPVLKQLLHYIYTAQPDDISSCAVTSLFAAAEKYDVKGLKKICIRYLISTMSPENVCDSIVLADMFMEQELKESAVCFLSKEASKVIPYTFWKKLVKEHPHLAAQMLESVVLSQKT